MSAMDKPNVSLALASSYNERRIEGYVAITTNAQDQRKINSIYEVARNAASGKSTVYLVKRPGFTIISSDFGATGDKAYLTNLKPGVISPSSLSLPEQWLFSTVSNNCIASSESTTTTIVTAADYTPAFVDKFLISGVENLVVQLWDSGSNIQTVWYSTAIATFTQITDADFTGLVHRGKMEFMDGYAFVLTSTNKIYNSDLNSIANWTATSFLTKQIKQDVANGLARLGKQILAFGYETMEVFQNNGNATGSPLSTVSNLAQNVGLAVRGPKTTHYYATLGNAIYFVGKTQKLALESDLSVYKYNGASMEKISNNFIDKLLNDNGYIYCVTTFSVTGKDAVAFCFDNTSSTTPRWLMFFPEWNDWFEWTSTTVMPSNQSGVFMGVGANQHRLYGLSVTDNWQDNVTDFTWTHQFQLPSEGNQRKFMPMCALQGNTQTSAQNISVEFSDNDGASYQTGRDIDMTSAQKMITRCGSWQGRRMVRLSHTGNTEVRLEKFLARVE